MFKAIWTWIKSIRKKDVLPIKPIQLEEIVSIQSSKDTNTVYLNDPTTPELIHEEMCVADNVLPMIAVGEGGCGFPLGSIQQQSLACKQMVNHALKLMSKASPVHNWSAVKSLTIMARAGQDVNAYYDRSSLRFFYFGNAKNKVIFACDSRSVVVHEFGHAFLDILRPDFWDVQASEIWAFHEFFGDATAMLSLLDFDEIVDYAIKETNGNLHNSNIVTRLAAEMGQGLHTLTQGRDGGLSNCLRDLSICYKYEIPENLPTSGPDNKIINEPHSFSRILSSTFYQAIIRIAEKQDNLKNGIKVARDIMLNYLIEATKNCPATIRFFDAFCRQILHCDQKAGGKYSRILKDLFVERNLIKPQILMLSDINADEVVKSIQEPHEISIGGNEKIIRTLSTKKIKITNTNKILTLSDNPLYDLEIEVPNQTAYYFEDDKLTGISESNDDEIIDSALTCLNLLHENKLVGNHDQALFDEDQGKLIRKRIVCTCGRSNACIPGQPEYNKPWKPANNSGCVKCSQKNCKPKSCDCNQPPVPAPPKTGCYTPVKVGGITVYKSGGFASRKVC